MTSETFPVPTVPNTDLSIIELPANCNISQLAEVARNKSNALVMRYLVNKTVGWQKKAGLPPLISYVSDEIRMLDTGNSWDEAVKEEGGLANLQPFQTAIQAVSGHIDPGTGRFEMYSFKFDRPQGKFIKGTIYTTGMQQSDVGRIFDFLTLSQIDSVFCKLIANICGTNNIQLDKLRDVYTLLDIMYIPDKLRGSDSIASLFKSVLSEGYAKYKKEVKEYKLLNLPDLTDTDFTTLLPPELTADEQRILGGMLVQPKNQSPFADNEETHTIIAVRGGDLVVHNIKTGADNTNSGDISTLTSTGGGQAEKLFLIPKYFARSIPLFTSLHSG